MSELSSSDSIGDEKQKPRLFIPNFLAPDQYEELEFIHKSSCAVGYRPHVFSTTLSHLVTTNSAHLIVPLVPIRESLKERVESFFRCEFELCIEFTGLIRFIYNFYLQTAGVKEQALDGTVMIIGPLLNRGTSHCRTYAGKKAVCYLNSYGIDFEGGLFHFQDGEPEMVAPSAGDVLIYTADSHNIHSVDEITMGERLTLTLWFSHYGSHYVDAKLISHLSRILPRQVNDVSSASIVPLPLPASDIMYWYSAHQSSSDSGINICCARLHALGFSIYSSSEDPLAKPLKVIRKGEFFNFEFSNVLHALQALQYCFWKVSESRKAEVKTETSKEVPLLSPSQKQRVHRLELIFLKDFRLLEMSFGRDSGTMDDFSWDRLAATIGAVMPRICI